MKPAPAERSWVVNKGKAGARLDVFLKALPGYRNYQIATGRAGVEGRKYHGFASLWLPHERRGDFTRMVNRCRNRHGYTDDIAWGSISPTNASFYVDIVESFFADSRFMVHLIITAVMPSTDSSSERATRTSGDASRCSIG